MPRGWEGNHRSGVAQAMHHRLSGLSTYGLKDLRQGDEHSACTPVGYGTFIFTLETIAESVVHMCDRLPRLLMWGWQQGSKWSHAEAVHSSADAEQSGFHPCDHRSLLEMVLCGGCGLPRQHALLHSQSLVYWIQLIVFKKKVEGWYSSLWELISSELWSIICHMESHSL